MAEEIVEVDIGEDEVIGVPKAPNKDTNTIVKVVTGEDVTIPSEEQRKVCSQVPVGDDDHPEYPAWQDSARVRAKKIKIKKNLREFTRKIDKNQIKKSENYDKT